MHMVSKTNTRFLGILAIKCVSKLLIFIRIIIFDQSVKFAISQSLWKAKPLGTQRRLNQQKDPPPKGSGLFVFGFAVLPGIPRFTVKTTMGFVP